MSARLRAPQAEKRLSEYLKAAAVESHVEASLAELETCMDTVWQHYREHVTGLPDLFLKQVTDESVDEWQVSAVGGWGTGGDGLDYITPGYTTICMVISLCTCTCITMILKQVAINLQL